MQCRHPCVSSAGDGPQVSRVGCGPASTGSGPGSAASLCSLGGSIQNRSARIPSTTRRRPPRPGCSRSASPAAFIAPPAARRVRVRGLPRAAPWRTGPGGCATTRTARCAACAGRGTAPTRRRRASSAQLSVEALGDGHHRRLGRGVLRRVRQRRDAAVAGRGVDDVALVAVREHHRHEGVDAVDDAPHVDREGPLPVVELVLPHPALGAGADAGVVAQRRARRRTPSRAASRSAPTDSYVGDVGRARR